MRANKLIKIVVPFLIFSAYFWIGINHFKDYGVIPDDLIERQSSVIAFNMILPYSCSDPNCPDKTDLYTYSDRYYGTFLQLPTVLIEYLNGSIRMNLQGM